MKTFLKFLFGLLSIALTLTSCADEGVDENQYPVHTKTTVQFAISSDSVDENGSEKTISILLSRPSRHNNIIKVSIDTLFTKFFTSTPQVAGGIIAIPVNEKDSKAEFRVKPVDNLIGDGNKQLKFALKQMSEEFQLGVVSQYILQVRDDDSPSEEKKSYVNFIIASPILNESDQGWQEFQIHVSEFASAEGSLLLEAKSGKAIYGTHFVTEPSLQNNSLSLNAAKGTPVLKFRIKPINDNVIFGNYVLTFTIKEVTGNLLKGAMLKDSVNINDDELFGLPKGYEITGGSWALNKTFTYSANGKIAHTVTNSYTPYHRSSVDTYYYNHAGLLTRISTSAGEDLLYSYENGRIVTEQKVDRGIIDRYTEYDYDAFGNVSGYQTHYLQTDGSFSLSSITVLLYFTEGNLYKKLVYTPSENPDEPYLTSTETYENYLDVENLFGIELVPNVRAQKKLPGSYRIESNGKDLRYNFTYEYRNDGKVSKRVVSGPGIVSETAVYHYY